MLEAAGDSNDGVNLPPTCLYWGDGLARAFMVITLGIDEGNRAVRLSVFNGDGWLVVCCNAGEIFLRTTFSPVRGPVGAPSYGEDTGRLCFGYVACMVPSPRLYGIGEGAPVVGVGRTFEGTVSFFFLLAMLAFTTRTNGVRNAIASQIAGRPLAKTAVRLSKAALKAITSVSNGCRFGGLGDNVCALRVECVKCGSVVRGSVGIARTPLVLGFRVRTSTRALDSIAIITHVGEGASITVVASRHQDLMMRDKMSTRRVDGARSGSTSRIVGQMPNMSVVSRGFIVMHKLSRECGGM